MRRPRFSSSPSAEVTAAECSSTMRWTRWAMRSNASPAVRPDASREVTLDAHRCLSPATRIMKNSSRFDETIARNFIRSISGTSADEPSPSTRWLNSSQLNSRLR